MYRGDIVHALNSSYRGALSQLDQQLDTILNRPYYRCWSQHFHTASHILFTTMLNALSSLHRCFRAFYRCLFVLIVLFIIFIILACVDLRENGKSVCSYIYRYSFTFEGCVFQSITINNAIESILRRTSIGLIAGGGLPILRVLLRSLSVAVLEAGLRPGAVALGIASEAS